MPSTGPVAVGMNAMVGRDRFDSIVSRGGKQPRESGAALLEAALVLPLVILLFMGLIDLGMAIADFNSLRQGDREGIRRAVVADVGSNAECPISGTTPTDDTAAFLCLTKQKTGLDPTKTRLALVFNDEYEEGDELVLCGQYQLHSRTRFFGFLLDTKVVQSKVSMRIEKASLDIQAFQETGAGDWGWCA